MKERPILFNGEMVRAILEGRKTQTRRIIKNPEQWMIDDVSGVVFAENQYGESYQVINVCPYGKPGDQLWVRESFEHLAHGRNYGTKLRFSDGEIIRIEDCPDHDNKWRPLEWKKRPSIHMPRWASRILLEVVSVRVERLREISEEDAKAEGVGLSAGLLSQDYLNYKRTFHKVWDYINAKRGYGWDKNPWVWVVEFQRVEP